MSQYYCKECDQVKNRKWDVCHEDPRNGPLDYELVCTDCYNELLEQLGMTEEEHEEKLRRQYATL